MANYTGVVKWFDNDRGYGFISANDGKDLHEGEEVSFDVVDAPKGLSAINVSKL